MPVPNHQDHDKPCRKLELSATLSTDAHDKICAMSDAERKVRAEKRRKSATLVRTTLNLQDRDPHPIRGPEAVSLVWRLTRESWSLGGLENPIYNRASIPHRFVRGRLT